MLLALLVALAVRMLVVAFLYRQQVVPERDYFHFGWETGRVARSLALGRGFSSPLFGDTGPTAWVTPLYTYLVAGTFKLFGVYTPRAAFAVLALNSLFSALTCVPIFLLACRAFGSRVAIWAAWAWALFPYAIDFSAERVWGDCLNALLVTLVILFAVRVERSGRLRHWAEFGLLAGVTALATTPVVAIVPVLGAWIAYRIYRRGGEWRVGAATAALVFVLAVSPWFIRNYRTFGRFVPFRDNFWAEVRVGNTGDTSDLYPDWAHPSTSNSEMEEFRRLGEFGYLGRKREQALAFIHDHPGGFAFLTLRRAIYFWTGFWNLNPQFLASEPFYIPNIFFSTALFALMLAGLRTAFRERNPLGWPLAAVIIVYPLVFYITHPSMDYRHAIDPMIVVLATYGALTWGRSRAEAWTATER
jgi:4-amino-4-deoxy-L-arabinose transferase-like glycosyltransferase